MKKIIKVAVCGVMLLLSGLTVCQGTSVKGPLIGVGASAVLFGLSVGSAAAIENWKHDAGKEVEQEIFLKTQLLKEVRVALGSSVENGEKRALLLLQEDVLKQRLKALKNKRPFLVKLFAAQSASVKKAALGAWIATGLSGAVLLGCAGRAIYCVNNEKNKVEVL